MAKNREILCKQYASTEKNVEVPKHFMAFLRTLVIALTIHVGIMRLLLPSANICHLLKAIHYTTKYAPYLRWSRGEKLNCLVQMNICALRLIIIEHDPVDFIFTWPFLLEKC